MVIKNFPHPAKGPGYSPPATIENVAFLLDENKITCRYNEVKKKVEIDIPGHRGGAVRTSTV